MCPLQLEAITGFSLKLASNNGLPNPSPCVNEIWALTLGLLYSSFISGHGRNWGIGSITGCYSSTLVGSDENLGIYGYEFKFLTKTLSNGCLPMVRKFPNGEVELIIYNFNA